MKEKLLSLIVLIVLLFSSCLTTTRTNNTPKPPRREFISVETTDLTIEDTFVVSDSCGDYGLEPSVNSRVFATAMFLKDLGILNEISSSEFEVISKAVFTNYPASGEVKEIVIPSLSKYQKKGDEETVIEKDAYLFVTHFTTDTGQEKFRIETNIPISSIYDKYYDGYFINTNSSFHKDIIPASWIAVMSIAFEDDVIVYKGVQFPPMASLLNYSGTGIGVDNWMNNPISPDSEIKDVMVELESVVEKATAELSDVPEQKESQLFLRKYSALTLSAYAYLNGDSELSRTYLEQAGTIEVTIPDNSMGKKYEGLEEVVSYIHSENT